MSNSSICPINRNLLGVTIPGQSGPGSDGNERVLHILQSSIKWFSVIFRRLVVGVLPFCRDVVSVFYRHSQLGYSLNCKPLKLVDQYIYISSNISSAESSVNICTGKAWNTVHRLITVWNTNLWWNQTWILLSCSCVSTTVWLHYLGFYEMPGQNGNYTRILHTVWNIS